MIEEDIEGCNLPPAGWQCIRGAGHDGPCAAVPVDPAGGAALIAAERARQLTEEGYSSEHDDRHGDSSLAVAAACYAMPERLYVRRDFAVGPHFQDPWPWRDSEDARKRQSNYPNAIPTEGPERVRILVKAGALIAAEIDRLERIA